MLRYFYIAIAIVTALIGAWMMGDRHGQDFLMQQEFPGQQRARFELFDTSLSSVQKWNILAREAIASQQMSPPEASRFLAMLHSAIFNAANIADQKYAFYHDRSDIFQNLANNSEIEWNSEILIDAAAVEIFSLFFDEYTTLLSHIENQHKNDKDADESLRTGHRVSVEMRRLRWNDGAHTPSTFHETDATPLGEWRTTPPYYESPMKPLWGDVRPFAITSLDAYDPGPPPAITSQQYAQELRHVAALGSYESSVRTREQSEIALFWADGKGTVTPPGHWNEIASTIMQQNTIKLDPVEEARIFALLNISLADASIVTWDAKYRYNHWRPVDAIRNAQHDGNPDTIGDEEWFNFVDTPNFPEYPSGHSVFSAAGATVLISFFGDHVEFTTTSRGLPGVERSFKGPMIAAYESGMSRIYGGIHFTSADRNGRAIGERIAQDVLERMLVKSKEESSNKER